MTSFSRVRNRLYLLIFRDATLYTSFLLASSIPLMKLDIMMILVLRGLRRSAPRPVDSGFPPRLKSLCGST